MNKTIAVWAAALVGGAFGPHAGADAPRYRARLITPGLSAINASGMNEAGDVVGTATTGSGAWVSHAGAAAVLLPLPPNTQYAVANDINDAGVIVGAVSSTSYPGFGRAAAWSPDGAGGYTITVFGTLPGHVSSGATALNNVGDIVGSSHNGMFSYPVLFRINGGIQNLAETGIFDPVDINDDRIVIDHSAQCKKLDLNTMIVEDLGVPAGPPSYVGTRGEVINAAGQVAGAAILATSTNCDHQAVTYVSGIGWDVISSCGLANSAWDMNDNGDVVMRLNVAPYVQFQGTGTFLVEDLIIADVGHWYVINGYGLAINNARQMAVPASNPTTGESGVVLLTPIGMSGDVDGDGDVDITDLAVLLSAFGSCRGDGAFDARPDFDGSGCVELGDLAVLLGGFGR